VGAPVRALLGDARDVYVSPDGALSLVPFASLVDEGGRFLVERHRFTVLSTGRDLLRYGMRASHAAPPLVVGGPAYGPVPKATAVNDGARGARSVDLTKIRFAPLPGALTEAKSVGGLLPEAKVLTEGEATEGAVKAA